ncbi:putative RNA methyltransferase [Aerococcus kribbianus]|uniref:Methyltransferase domain-containing protein n=1 Tax=Aerococcus kribbianus TaxID=2999064 RepID=A0A9X3FSF5_9LACT|nr:MULTISPECIES: methyltransferase domain-containing protein [unclassified Aerococcus]MCZ0717542.1 methyltransferase domain-containing protein [Aerococcus sp. YH-aer221]MCZ0725830.1 methyltransferase domain-containing protein [Aerococcus sp. YH-aer222]
MLSKRQTAIQRLEDWQDDLTCPHCQEKLAWTGQQVSCPQGHSFDLAKSGYLNLAPQHQEKHYHKDLFVARYQLMAQHEFYQGIYQDILALLDKHHYQAHNSCHIIDLGTGEGSHFDQFLQAYQSAYPQDNFAAMGFDLAKDGIQIAAKHHYQALWTVADLGHIPLADNSVDLALTILSPSNYNEVKRVLKTGGYLIKVIPGPNYLAELRACVLSADKQKQDSQTTMSRFQTEFNQVDAIDYQRDFTLNSSSRDALLKMTPLTWHADAEQLAAAQKLSHIQVDLKILIGKN